MSRHGTPVIGCSALVAGGGYGRYVAVCAEHLTPVPDNLSFVEAAAAAEVFYVAFLNLFLEANLQPSESLLVHGGGGGVGTSAIQLARAAGVTVYITAGSADKVKRCLELGAHYGIDYKLEDFTGRILKSAQVKESTSFWTGLEPPTLGRHLQILKNRGRLLLIGLLGGNQGEVQLAPLLSKRLHIMGSVLRSRCSGGKGGSDPSFSRPRAAASRIRRGSSDCGPDISHSRCGRSTSVFTGWAALWQDCPHLAHRKPLSVLCFPC